MNVSLKKTAPRLAATMLEMVFCLAAVMAMIAFLYPLLRGGAWHYHRLTRVFSGWPF
jgi:hypothetical protein